MCVVCAAQQPDVQSFVRWGRNSCDNIANAAAIYTGWAGSGYANASGSGSSLLWCAPPG